MILGPLRPMIVIKVERAIGEDIDRRKHLNFPAGPGVMPLGHNHPEIREVVRRRFPVLIACSGNASNVQAVEFGKKLTESARRGLN